MRNYKGAFYRTDETSREPEQESSYWLNVLATTLKDEAVVKTAAAKSAVEVARERQSQPSIYEMMSAIVSGQKPKYSSVEEAVKDYQRRTGLEDYLKRGNGDNDLSVLASLVTEAAHGVCEKCGCAHSECECDDNGAANDRSDWHPSDLEDLPESEGLEIEEPDFEEVDKPRDWRDAFKSDPNDPDISDEERNERTQRWLENSDGGDARDMTTTEREAHPGKKKLITEAGDEDLEVELAPKPEILQKNPAIEHFIINLIDTNIGIQMPAILSSLIETFGRDGVNHEVYSDRELLTWINNKLISKGIANNDIPSHLGRGVGTHIDYSGEKDSNKDPFTLLEPNKSSI